MSPQDVPPVRPEPDVVGLDELQALYDAGRYLDARHAAQRFSSVETWTSTAARILGGRLAAQWGDAALGNRLFARAYRDDPANDTAFYYFILNVHAKHGAFEALRLLCERTSTFEGVPDTKVRAHLWIEQARLLGVFRDFDAADTCLALAEKAFPESPWLWTEKAGLLREQDRYDEALAAARKATRLRAWYRPAVQAQVHLLQLLNRDDEALALLEEAQQHLQCAALVQSQAGILDERSHNAEMLAALARLDPLQPLASTHQLRWRAARRCDAAYRLGNYNEALAAAREAGPGYYEEIARQLSGPASADARRVQLPVGFVRQHHMTCAPATMAALSRFWEQPVDHLALARAICYDGTPAHLERAWAEEQGWVVREFRVTWDSARALLDRGCPFALVTVGVRSGHMQAVIGYDSRLGTLLIRDPYLRAHSEWLASALFETHASSGPRGMIMIPREQASRLDGVELADEAMHTHLHRLQHALARHDRNAAEVALNAMESADADHTLTHKARFELAYYDANPEQALPPVRQLRRRFPKDVNLQLDELQLLQQLGQTAAHRELLHELGNQPFAPLVFQRQEAEELTQDARQHPRAFKLLRRALRRHSNDPRTLVALANLLWETGRLEEATRLYRLAACSADKVESHWDSYFKASRHLHETEESLALIRRRFELLGDLSGQPARTLFECLEALDRSHEAFAVLDAALVRRPDDGDLRLFIADAQGRYGRYAEAAQALQAASDKASPAAWRRTAANIAGYQGDHALALKHWREIASLNPADTFAHSSIARLLSIVESRAAAVRYLDEACAHQPHLLPLRQTHIQWLRDESVARVLEAIDALLALDPDNAWAHREKALALVRVQRAEDALASADEALRIAPFAPTSHGVRADVLRALDRLPEARESYRAGIRLTIDADWLFNDLVSACPDFATRREAVSFIQDELLRQPSLNNACLQFRSVARSILPAQELQDALETLWKRHPETWSVWSVLINHLLDQDLATEALAKARDATARFPLTPRLWLDLAEVHFHLGNLDAAREANEKALAISPAWSTASRQLSKIHERTLRLDLAAQVLRRAIALDPNDAINHGWLADVLWRKREPEEAFASIERTIAIAPDYDWAWGRLDEWSTATGQPERALRLAENLTQTRPGEAESWIRLVRLRFQDHSPDANLEALDRATSLAPRNPDIHDLRAELLAFHKRYDEALAACKPAIFGASPPPSLLGRAAWIEHRRGHPTKAIHAMHEVVEAHPDYLWGWSLLTRWHWDQNEFAAVKKAAARWAWLAPHASLPHGYIAIIHKQDGNKKEAKDALVRSIAADPAYEFGAFELLALQLADSEFDGARQTLRHIDTHFPAATSIRAQLHFHRAAKNREAAREQLQALARLPDLPPGELAESSDLALEAGWKKELEKAIASALSDPAALPELGRHWATARRGKPLALTLYMLWRVQATPAHRRHVHAVLIEQMVDRKRTLTLRFFCLLRRRELRSHDDSWGKVGYAFNATGLHRFATRWMSDWREHPDAGAWTFVNLVQALYCRKNIREAREALISALERPRDHTHDMLLVWMACEQALDGDPAGARNTQRMIPATGLSDYDKALLTFTDCMCMVQEAEPENRPAAFAEAKAKLHAKTEELPAVLTAPALKLFYRRTLHRLGTDGGSRWLRIRSRLPFLGGTEVLGNPLAWIALVVVLGGLRGCAALIQ